MHALLTCPRRYIVNVTPRYLCIPGLGTMLELLVRYGFAIVAGADSTPEGTRLSAERLCFVQTTTFGDIWCIKVGAYLTLSQKERKIWLTTQEHF